MRTLGIERERFITNDKNEIVSEVGILLPRVKKIASLKGLDEEKFTYELFAGQIEDRSSICKDLKEVEESLRENDIVMNQAAAELGLSYEYSEIVDDYRLTDLRVNPFNERHQKIFDKITMEQKIAASQVAAVHVHVSVEEEEVATALNIDREYLHNLIKLGDHSDGRRISTYQIMGGKQQFPPLFNSFDEIMNYINSKGGEKNVYDLIRYKPSTKTIEFRMFGTTGSIEEILNYTDECQKLIMRR